MIQRILMLAFIMPVETISLQDLQSSSQFKLAYSRVYPKNGPVVLNGHRYINTTIYMLMPALNHIAGI